MHESSGAGVQGFDAEAAHRARLMQAGRMLAGVVHEINNPLAVIQGYAQLLHDRLTCEDDRRDLQCILDEARRLATLVDDMLSFTRRGADVVETVEVQRVVQSSLNLTLHDMRQARVSVVATCPREPVLVRGSHGGYVQVLLNLLGNARHSLEEGRRDGRCIRIRVEPADGGPGGARRTCLVVANNGPPIPSDLAEVVFEPFFTTKGEGSGLGLALCRELLGRWGASIALDPPEAAEMPVSFRLTLPPA
jgi:signal transduction histidine kinase